MAAVNRKVFYYGTSAMSICILFNSSTEMIIVEVKHSKK